MKTKERARAMWADGKSIDEISSLIGVGKQWVYKCVNGIGARTPKQTSETVVRYGAHNGGCSTLSGMMPVSLPRIRTLDGEYAT